MVEQILIALTPNNREKALLFYLVVFLFFCVFYKDIRKHIPKIFFSLMKMWFFWILNIIYITILCFLLFNYQLLTISDLKVVIVWCFTALGMFGLIIDKKSVFLIVFQMISISMFVEIIIDYSRFSLITELILVLLLFISGMLYIVSTSDYYREQNPHKFNNIVSNIFLTIACMILTIQLFYGIIFLKEEVSWILFYNLIRSSFIPILLTVLYSPFLISCRWYAKYSTKQSRKKFSKINFNKIK